MTVPESWDEAVALCRMAAAEGTETIVATPHVLRDRWLNEVPAERDRLVLRLNALLEGRPAVVPGCELFFSADAIEFWERGANGPLVALGRGSHLLIEFPSYGVPSSAEFVFYELALMGVTPVIAHPERNAELMRNPDRLEALVARGARTQITAAAPLGEMGRSAQAAAEDFYSRGLVHLVASDAHSIDRRPPRLAAARQWVARKWGAEAERQLRDQSSGRPRRDCGGEPRVSDPAPAAAAGARWPRPLLALVCIALAAASIGRYRADEEGRLPAAAFLQTFDVTLRRPAEAETLPLVPQADLTANLVAAVALDDALGTVDLREVTPDVRQRWLRAAERVDDELAAAQAMTVEALAVRPGWPVHWAMLGKLAFAIQRRQHFAASAHDARLWQMPLAAALRHAPGDDGSAAFLSAATLETWPDRTPQERAAAASLFRRALLDGGFALGAFPQVIGAMGRERAVELLPDKAITLRAAFAALAGGDDVQVSELLYRRWEATEWWERQSGLQEIEERARLNDVERLRNLTLDWMQQHPPSDFDTAPGRAQTLRVLQLAVNDRIGPWRSDPGRLRGALLPRRPDGIRAAEATGSRPRRAGWRWETRPWRSLACPSPTEPRGRR